MSDYELWKEKYYNEKKVDYSKYFSDEDITLLHKLGVKIDKTKKYSEHEHDLFEMDIIIFYEDAEDIYENKLPPEKNIDEVGVSKKDYSRLLDILYQIAVDYEF